MNADLAKLQPYPFEKLADLKASAEPPNDLTHIALSIGEPKHDAPEFVLETIRNNLQLIEKYPLTKGLPELRETIANWLSRRFSIPRGNLDPESQILPVAGTREALFAFAQATVDRTKPKPTVVCPNPFYQIYEGAAFLAGAQPHFVNCNAGNKFLPDFNTVPQAIWDDCQVLFLCSPGNPTGAVVNEEQLSQLIELADKHDFIIASDECYSELYFDEDNAPVGLLETCEKIGRHDYARCVVFHSLSKRSNLPGLRSGFVAGDSSVLKKFLQYRTYHGCALPVPTQLASIAAWNDETHVKTNRALYKEKFDAVLNILDGCLEVSRPDASFYLWPKTPIADTEFARRLYAEKNITALPGRFLARDTETGNPGENYLRIALVAPLEECIEAAKRIRDLVLSIKATAV